MDNDLSFGRWVKVRRVALRLTQANLGERTGYSTVTIRKIESDDLRPSDQIIDKLAEALALAPAERSDFIRRGRVEMGGVQRRHQSSSPALPHASLPDPSLPHPA